VCAALVSADTLANDGAEKACDWGPTERSSANAFFFAVTVSAARKISTAAPMHSRTLRQRSMSFRLSGLSGLLISRLTTGQSFCKTCRVPSVSRTENEMKVKFALHEVFIMIVNPPVWYIDEMQNDERKVCGYNA